MAITALALGLNDIYGGMLLLMGILFTILSYPLTKRMVKMNHAYGVRLPQSFSSEENWYNINAYGGKLLMIWGIFIAVVGVVLLFIPITDYPVGLVILLVAMATMAIPVMMMYNYARQLTAVDSR